MFSTTVGVDAATLSDRWECSLTRRRSGSFFGESRIKASRPACELANHTGADTAPIAVIDGDACADADSATCPDTETDTDADIGIDRGAEVGTGADVGSDAEDAAVIGAGSTADVGALKPTPVFSLKVSLTMLASMALTMTLMSTRTLASILALAPTLWALILTLALPLPLERELTPANPLKSSLAHACAP